MTYRPVISVWDCIGRVPTTHHIRIINGRTLYEEAIYYDDTPGDKVKLARIDTTDGLHQVNRWVDADTPVELVRADGTVEPDAPACLL